MTNLQLEEDRDFLESFINPPPSFHQPPGLITRAEALMLLEAQKRVTQAEEREKLIDEIIPIVDEMHFWQDKSVQTFDGKAADQRFDSIIQTLKEMKTRN